MSVIEAIMDLYIKEVLIPLKVCRGRTSSAFSSVSYVYIERSKTCGMILIKNVIMLIGHNLTCS